MRSLSLLTILLALTAAPLAADVDITSPKPGAELTGTVQITAQVTPIEGKMIDRVVLQAESGDLLPFTPQPGGLYTLALDTTKLRNGRQTLLALESSKGVDLPRTKPDWDTGWKLGVRNDRSTVEVIVRNPYHYYWGDMHAHTSYSDGCGVPRDAYTFARDTAKLDFFSLAEHAQLLTFDEYADIIAQADAVTVPGKFVGLYGVESTEGDGHLCFYMSPTPILPGGRDALYEQLGARHLLGHFNHPNLNSPASQGWKDDFSGFHYVPAADQSMAMVEVRTTDEETAYIALLNAGWHVGAAGCEDVHDPSWGAGDTWTVALARSLTRQDLLDALWARRFYSAGDRNVQLTFTLDGEDMGAQLARKAGVLPVLVEVSDPDSKDVIEEVALFVDGKVAQTTAPKLSRNIWATTVTLPAGKHYCFVRLTQPTGRTWSSPIWVSAY